MIACEHVNACGDIDKHCQAGSARLSLFNSSITPHFSFSFNSLMSHQSGPSYLQELLESAFEEYEKQTGKTLANHPLAERLQNCDSVESVTAVLREQIEASSEIRGKDKVLKQLKNVISVLYKLSSASAVNFGQDLGLVRLKALIGFQYP
jgi:hypothetical protein